MPSRNLLGRQMKHEIFRPRQRAFSVKLLFIVESGESSLATGFSPLFNNKV